MEWVMVVKILNEQLFAVELKIQTVKINLFTRDFRVLRAVAREHLCAHINKWMKIVHSGKIINLLTLSLNYHMRGHTYNNFIPPTLSFKFSLALAYSFMCLLYTRKLLNNFPKHFHEYTRRRRTEQYDKHFISTAEWCYDNFHNHRVC